MLHRNSEHGGVFAVWYGELLSNKNKPLKKQRAHCKYTPWEIKFFCLILRECHIPEAETLVFLLRALVTVRCQEAILSIVLLLACSVFTARVERKKHTHTNSRIVVWIIHCGCQIKSTTTVAVAWPQIRTDFLCCEHPSLSHHQCFYRWNKWMRWSRSALHPRGNIRSLSSAGFHGNAQLISTSSSQFSRNVLDEGTTLDNICLFHLVLAARGKHNAQHLLCPRTCHSRGIFLSCFIVLMNNWIKRWPCSAVCWQELEIYDENKIEFI